MTVRPGESLASVAGACGLRVRELQRVNGIVDDALDAGETLRVTRPGAFEREPRLRRRTTRRLFQIADANSGEAAERDRDAGPPPNPRGRRSERVVAAPRRWRHRGWRFEPRGESARTGARVRVCAAGQGRSGRRRGGGWERARGGRGWRGSGGGSGAGERSSATGPRRAATRTRDARLFWNGGGSVLAAPRFRVSYRARGGRVRHERVRAPVGAAPCGRGPRRERGTPVLAARGARRARTFDGEGTGGF